MRTPELPTGKHDLRWFLPEMFEEGELTQDEFNKGTTLLASNGGSLSYNKQNQNILLRSDVGKKWVDGHKKRYYPSLFEEWVDKGYIDIEQVTTKQELLTAFEDAIKKNPRYKDKERRASSVAAKLVDQITRTTSYFTKLKQEKIIKLSKEKATIAQDELKERSYQKLAAKAAKDDAFLVREKGIKKFIYRDGNRWRDAKTGRFTKSIKNREKELIGGFEN